MQSVEPCNEPQLTSPLIPPAPAATPAPAKSKAQELSDAFVIGMINTIAAVPCNLAYVRNLPPHPPLQLSNHE
jgi:hypothetical protein